jgi:L-serine/L-threonine ammonia-lyase
MPLHLETPLIESRAFARERRGRVWLKFDALQPTGSFKIRGVGAACEHHAARGAERLLSSSGGNAGIAVAYAGRRLGIPVTVVVPETTTATALRLIAQEGAEVVVHGASWQEADTFARGLQDATCAFIHPFDDPLLWGGHATLIDEVVASGVTFDALVVSVGGGGLLAGMAVGLARHGLDRIPLVAVETAGADSLAQSLARGARVELPAITSIATSLGAKRVAARAFELCQERPVRSQVVDDRAALAGCDWLLEHHRVLVEPACGAALAAALTPGGPCGDYPELLVIVCGGATSSVGQQRAQAAALG